ncbi:flavonoid 3'-monooxygenase-like [Dorcoceras hygrometricum]|uniref:Flavonoid 3'-monooxygenase-like n=1 Tax=Dorcoceras hygrometricum TaxID=472368 RepID=A0A2Z7BWH3_9LAMI|nr:flavonoid 3'-monooxygenase-like [Dorcoceras hygrometricum]
MLRPRPITILSAAHGRTFYPCRASTCAAVMMIARHSWRTAARLLLQDRATSAQEISRERPASLWPLRGHRARLLRGRTRAISCAFSRGNRHFTVGGGRLRQSGPRPEWRLLRQPALEGLTRSARTDSPRQVGRNKFRGSKAAAAALGGGGGF